MLRRVAAATLDLLARVEDHEEDRASLDGDTGLAAQQHASADDRVGHFEGCEVRLAITSPSRGRNVGDAWLVG